MSTIVADGREKSDRPHLSCPLCDSAGVTSMFSHSVRSFVECSVCDLLFTTPSSDLSLAQEKKRYEQHNNCPTESGYLRHLDRMRIQLAPHLKSGSCGLDFGCGPAKGMSRLFESAGFVMENYDPFFGPALPQQKRQYDFITCAEVVEHFRDPKTELYLMQSLLKPGGWISIMTNLREGDRRVPTWWYLRDSTHRSFYSKRTIEFIAGMLSWRINSMKEEIVTFQASS